MTDAIIRTSRLAVRTSSLPRLVGIDLARFLAIVGMIVVHVSGNPLGAATRFLEGNSSTLFAVLGGVSVVLATRRYLESGEVAAARWAMVGRGAFVILVGILLSFAGGSAVIVLVYFGVAMWCSIPFLRAPAAVTLTVAGILAVGGPVLNGFVRGPLGLGNEGGSISVEHFVDPLGAFRAILLTGTYPVVTWLVYLLVGMVVCRLLLVARRRQRGMRFALTVAAVGAGVATAATLISSALGGLFRADRLAALPDGFLDTLPPGFTADDMLSLPGYGGPDWSLFALLGDNAHTGTLFDILRGVGVSLAVIGLCLALTWALPPVVLTLLRPVTAAGAAPLTVYSAHILLFALLQAWARTVVEGGAAVPWWYLGPGAIALHLGMVFVIGLTLAALRRRGPLETFATATSRLTARLGQRNGSA